MRVINRLRNSLQGKFILTLFVAISIGNLITFCIFAPMLKNKIADVLTKDLYIIADDISSTNNAEELEERINYYKEKGYFFDVMNNKEIENYNLTKDDLEYIKNNKLTKFNHKNGVSVVISHNNNYIVIGNIEVRNKLKHVSKLPASMLVISFSISCFLIGFVVKYLTKNITKLMKATNEIMDGNFDIYIKTKEKDEISQLINNFNKMAKELRNMEYMQKDFINNVSHEFKTPIFSIQGFARILKDDNLSNEERKEYLSIIEEETERLSKLSSNILSISKLENKDELEDKRKFSLDEQIRKTILLLENKWQEKNIEFDINLSKIYYYGAEDCLFQVWINILDNAIKFSNINGTIHIYNKRTVDDITIFIEDEGCGISKEVSKRIFEKFYQGDDSRAQLGVGLGLSIAKRIVNLSGGDIMVESELNKGSRFIVRLPY